MPSREKLAEFVAWSQKHITVWKPVVLMEMKKRAINLQKHYRQAFDYWTRLVPNRPRYVVL